MKHWDLLTHIAAILLCRWIGRLTPSAFVSTYHTIAALLFSHRGCDNEDKDELSFPPGPSEWTAKKKTQNTPADECAVLSQLRLFSVPMHYNENEVNPSHINQLHWRFLMLEILSHSTKHNSSLLSRRKNYNWTLRQLGIVLQSLFKLCLISIWFKWALR